MATCPTCNDCDDLVLPAVSFDECLLTSLESEIGYLLVSVPDPTNTSKAELQSPNFSSPTLAATYIAPDGAFLIGIGDLPEPESAERDVSLRRKARDKKTFTLNFTIDDTNDNNYDFLRTLECGMSVFIHYITLGGKAYGDPVDGIKAKVVRANAPLDRGAGNYERFELGFEWESYCHPERQDTWLSEVVTT